MQLDTTQQAALAKIIANHASQSIIREAAQELTVLADFETILKSGPSSPDARALDIATRLVRACCEAGRAGHLIGMLRRLLVNNEPFNGEINSFEIDATQDSAQQGRLAIRANMLSVRRLREFLNDVEGHVCLIASIVPVDGGGTVTKLGTGFLVGPDLVVTAYHTLRDKIDSGRQVPGSEKALFAFFDFCEGERIDDPLADIKYAKRIAFHSNWLVCSSPDFAKDGLLDPVGEETNKEELGKSLDHVLVRLAERVGAQTRSSGGGERRRWIDVRNGSGALAKDDRIIIAQHPHGKAQQIDFGRYSVDYSKLDVSETRFRYSTETDEGTSGAPCFNQRFVAVGMHNASYKPHGDPKGATVANQAISLAKIAACLPPPQAGDNAARLEASTLWNVGMVDDKPRVILSRRQLMAWIDRAAKEEVTTLEDRVHVAQGSGRGIGKTFSFEILQAARKNKSEPIVLLGTPAALIPTRGADLIGAIATQIGIGKAELSHMPPRPNVTDTGETRPADGDKLNKWSSDELPRWFNDVLRAHRTQDVDLVAEAKKQREALTTAGLRVSPEILDLANSQVPVRGERRRWSISWIVFDALDTLKFTPEVADVIAGLVGAQLAEASVPAELRRLRWIFLGEAPPFASGFQTKPENLDPKSVGPDDWMEMIKAYADSLDRRIPDNMVAFFKAMPRVFERRDKAAFEDPATRLQSYQTLFGDYHEEIAVDVKGVS